MISNFPRVGARATVFITHLGEFLSLLPKVRELLKILVSVIGTFVTMGTYRSQLGLHNGKCHRIRPLMNKDPALETEMSSLGKFDSLIDKLFAY